MISSREMYALEENVEEFGLNRRLLMENAGSAIADYLKSKNLLKDILLAAGTGNKAGDGFVAIRHVIAYGGSAKVLMLEREERLRTEEARANFELIKKLPNVEIYFLEELEESKLEELFNGSKVIIDGIIGTGLRGKPSKKILEIIKRINSSRGFKLSIDIPTGIDPDSGEAQAEYVKPNVVITMHRMKKGLAKHIGEFDIIEANIGIPKEYELFVGKGDARMAFREKSPYSKKGDSGKVLIIGGSQVYHGAPILAGLAALRSGVDLVYLYLPEKIVNVARTIAPEFIALYYEGDSFTKEAAIKAKEIMERVDVILIGNGLGIGCDEGVEEVFNFASEKNKLLVADADALKTSIAKKPPKIKAIFTPHSKEFEILTGYALEDYQEMEKRIEKVRKASEELGVVLLVKGYYDVISDGEKAKICIGGTQAMTVGGTGDVLAGLCAGILARSKMLLESALAASYINKTAGSLATKKFGNQMKASDLIKFIPKIIKGLDPTYKRNEKFKN